MLHPRISTARDASVGCEVLPETGSTVTVEVGGGEAVHERAGVTFTSFMKVGGGMISGVGLTTAGVADGTGG